MFRRILKYIRPLGSRELLNWVPDEIYLKLVYRAYIGEKLDLEHPQSYNEKLQWLKLFYRRPELTSYVDKYKVREFVIKKIGEEYLIPLLDVYNSTDEIEWDNLPDKFVLKCNHGSGTNIVCDDFTKFDKDKSQMKLNKWLKKNWYWYGREWPYKNIETKIICEQFLETEDGKLPTDYKFMCFNGKAKMIQVFTDRLSNKRKDFYTLDWTKTDIVQGSPNSDIKVPKPDNLSLMIELAETLSQGLPFVRVDFYEVQGKIYFGELTFYPGSGFIPFANKYHDKMFGDYIRLPKPVKS